MNRSLRTWMTLPVAALAATGCLATRADVELLRTQLHTMDDSARVQRARSDSLNARLIRDVAQQLNQSFARDLASVSDSVRQVAGAVQRLQGDVTLAMHDVRQQLVTVQEGIGQSQKGIQTLRSAVEAGSGAPGPVAAPKAGDSTHAAGPAAPPAGVLFDMARGQLRSGATGAAREGFQTLLASYPNDDRAAQAQMYIGNAYEQEGNKPAADSVYALVASKYQDAFAVPQALYKRGMILKAAGRGPEADKLFQQILAKYPQSNEGRLLQDQKKP